jgi:hypothetical protein
MSKKDAKTPKTEAKPDEKKTDAPKKAEKVEKVEKVEKAEKVEKVVVPKVAVEGEGSMVNLMDDLSKKQAFKKFSWRGKDINQMLALKMPEFRYFN